MIIVCEISGLTAERHINTRGIPVVILEGRDCLGGCIHTMDIAGSGTTWVDLITSWIENHFTRSVYKPPKNLGKRLNPAQTRPLLYQNFPPARGNMERAGICSMEFSDTLVDNDKAAGIVVYIPEPQ